MTEPGRTERYVACRAAMKDMTKDKPCHTDGLKVGCDGCKFDLPFREWLEEFYKANHLPMDVIDK